MYWKWRFQSWGHFLSSLYQFSTRSSSMASVEFCKIPPLPWPSMASTVAWTSIESIGWIPWKWSPIAPWIPHKLSVESMEANRKRRKLMPLNFPLNFPSFGKSMEIESEYSMEVAVDSTEFHGNLRDGSGSANACIIRLFWVTESKSTLVFVKFLYGISLSQNTFFYYKERSGHKICCPSWSRYFFSNYMGAR